MFKRHVTEAALILHLLLVLMLASDSNQSPSCFGSISVEELMTKLSGDYLKPDEVFALMDKVSCKSQVAIGETNVKELVKMNEINSKRCYDRSFRNRKRVFEAATLVNLPNVDGYCRDRLSKLSQLCAKQIDVSDSEGFPDAPITEDTVKFFRDLLKGYTPPPPQRNKFDYVDEYLGFKLYYGQELTKEEQRDYNMKIKKKERLFDNCMIYFSNVQHLGAVNYPKDDDANRLDMEFNAPGWSRVHGLCWYFFSRYRLNHHLNHFRWLWE